MAQVMAAHESPPTTKLYDRTSDAVSLDEVEDEVEEVVFEDSGDVKGLKISNGAVLKADLFIDSSGFAGEIIGKAMEVPFKSYADALFCDRALVGGWDREEGEKILPYTVSQTMDSVTLEWMRLKCTRPLIQSTSWGCGLTGVSVTTMTIPLQIPSMSRQYLD